MKVAIVSFESSIAPQPELDVCGYDRVEYAGGFVRFIWESKSGAVEATAFPAHRIYDISESVEEQDG